VDDTFWQYLEGFLLMEKFETDRFLTDFSRAWKGVPDVDPPRYWQEETAAYFAQQKQTATTISIGGGPTYISASEGADRLQIHGGTGYIAIEVDEIGEVIAALQQLRTLLKPASTPSSGMASAPARYETRPNHPGWKSQAQKNIEEMERALGIRRR
jgi:hypothetical protein